MYAFGVRRKDRAGIIYYAFFKFLRLGKVTERACRWRRGKGPNIAHNPLNVKAGQYRHLTHFRGNVWSIL